VVPSFAHGAFIEELIPHLEDGQIVIFNPGNFASLEFKRILEEEGLDGRVKVAETESLIYATRLLGPGLSHIQASKGEVLLSALPAKDTKKVLEKIRIAYPQFSPARNVFETSINNLNFIIHPAPVIMNASRIEEMGPYRYHHYGVTPSIARVMERMDGEKMLLSKALGLPQIPAKDILYRYYGAVGENLYDALRDCKAYKTQQSPESLTYRYIAEDVPYGLVPLASLGEELGVEMPTIKAIIQIASTMNQSDYWAEGRTVNKLGLAGMSAKEMIEYVTG
jgi:opine dehydrogenase